MFVIYGEEFNLIIQFSNKMQVNSMSQLRPSSSFFHSESHKTILINSTKYGQHKLQPLYFPYKDESIKLESIVEQYRSKIFSSVSSSEQQLILFELEGAGVVDPKYSIKDIKERLNNLQLENIQLNPRILDSKVNHFEPMYRNSKYYKSLDKIEILIKIPQFSLNIYTKITAELAQQTSVYRLIVHLIKTRADLALIKKHIKPRILQERLFILINITTDQPISLDSPVQQLRCQRKLLLKFYQVLKITPSQIIDRTILVINKSMLKLSGSQSTISYISERLQSSIFNSQQGQNSRFRSRIKLKDVIGYKVSALLEECGIANSKRVGLSILGRILKPSAKIDIILQYLSPESINDQVQAYLVYGFQLFYRIFRHQPEQLTYKEIGSLKLGHYPIALQFYTKYKAQFMDNLLSQYQVKYLILFSLNILFQKINKYLKYSFQLFNFDIVKEINRWEFKLTHIILKILKKLTNYQGKVYHYSLDSQKLTVGDIIHYKFFIATSRQEQKIFSEDLRIWCYIIESVSGKNMINYSRYCQNKQVVFLPYTHFQVLQVNKQQRFIRLREMPSVKKSNSSLLLWVDDDPLEGVQIFKTIFYQAPYINWEVINLVDNRSLIKWIDEFGCLMFNQSRKVLMITDMNRKRGQQERIEGHHTISIMKSCNPDIDIMVYISDPREANNVNGINQSIAVSTNPLQAKIFIQKYVSDQN